MKITLPGNYIITTDKSGFSLDVLIPAHISDKTGKEVKESIKNISYPSSLESACERYSMLYYEKSEFKGLRLYVEAIKELTKAVEKLADK